MSKAPLDANPWLVLRFNHVDGEVYGRGRVEEFLGDLKSLEALSQAVIEGSAAAAKVVFTVSPSSTTKPATLAKAGNGAIIQGRPDDIGVVQVGKTADFQTAYQMIGGLTQRLNEAFLVLNVRDSERTTAEEVRMTQLELEQQLGGLFSLLTVEFLVPYLNRKLNVAQKTGEIPRLPKGDIVKPTIVAGINALGRGQDRESLAQFMTVIAQTIGPEAIQQFINTDEVIKRLAAASGIDVLNLVKSMDEMQAEQQQSMAQQQQMMAMQQEPQMAAIDQKREQAAMQMMQQQPSLPPE
jgi:stage V sporulation protein SpoVS